MQRRFLWTQVRKSSLATMFTYLFIVSAAMCGALVLESQAEPLSWGPRPISLGPMEVVGKIGRLSRMYWPLTPRDQHASNNARFYAEEYRRFIKPGFGVIPPLDPYYEKNIPSLDIDDFELQGTIDLSNFVLYGAKEYYVSKLQVRLNSWRVDFVLEIALLKSGVDFHAKINVDNAHNDLKGHVKVSLHNVVIKGALSFKSWPKNKDPNHQKLSIVGAKYNVTSSNVQYNARDLNKNTRRTEGVSSHVIKNIAQKIAQEQAHTSALSILKLLNKALHHYTTAQVLAWLLNDNLKMNK